MGEKILYSSRLPKFDKGRLMNVVADKLRMDGG